MTLRTNLLLAATAVCCFTALLAFPMDGFATNNKCRCITTTKSVIPPRLFKRIEILPQGANCREIEIVITKKNNQVVCIDPRATWIKNVLPKLMKSHRKVKESI
ncbi:C-X-C motif chemokine 13 [Triplophysa dalaica]|uniref:C-X-C motif chemokine 13 n=1 Tax=Triplophysa dalaica TaxID=1582913 RepID=UPI0024DF37D7|nr:C-X-C motif chemokine 13 [Triplophysa dalaica]